MTAKKTITAILVILVAVGGFVAGLYLLRQRQELREEAAVPGGQAEVSISPESGNFDVGSEFETSVYFNTANIAISGIQVRLTYPYSGTTPEITVSEIVINSNFTSSPDWNCPTYGSTQEDTNMVIEIACANISSSGFTSNTNTLFANIKLKVDRQPQVSPIVLRFESAESRITRKSDNADILLVPTSIGSYSIGGVSSVTNTPTPTVRLTGSVTPTPTKNLTSTPTTVGSATLTPTAGQLPDAGVSYPAIMGIAVGVLVIMGAFMLAI